MYVCLVTVLNCILDCHSLSSKPTVLTNHTIMVKSFNFFFEKAELYLSIYQDINPCFSNKSLLIIRGSS